MDKKLEPLTRAVKAGDLTLASALLSANPDLIHWDMGPNDEHRVLHFAVLRRDSAMVRLLMEAGADAHKGIFPHRDATSALTIAEDRGYDEIVAIINEQEQQSAEPSGIQVRDSDVPLAAQQTDAETAIRAAVALGDTSRVSDLVRGNPESLRQIDHSGGLLSLAVEHGHAGMAGLLLDLGADVDERIMLPELEEPTASWGMPLWHAALAGNLEITELLLARGADPNANVYASGWPLRNAWSHKDESVKLLLLAHGARRQPYMVAEMCDIEEARRILDSTGSEEVIHELLWSAADHGCPEIVQLALPRLQWQLADPRWHWVLIQPVRGAAGPPSDNHGQFACMQLLLQHGIDPNLSRFGQTLLHYVAARHGNLSGAHRAAFAAMLLDYGARLDSRDDLLQSTPLGWACRWGHQKVVELLLARGAPANEPEAEAWATPQAWAAKKHHAGIHALLHR